jgi:large subunit ribosomal protein L21e
MPHKVYQGRTGVVWNVTKRSIGVEVNKQVRSSLIVAVQQNPFLICKSEALGSLHHFCREKKKKKKRGTGPE